MAMHLETWCGVSRNLKFQKKKKKYKTAPQTYPQSGPSEIIAITPADL